MKSPLIRRRGALKINRHLLILSLDVAIVWRMRHRRIHLLRHRHGVAESEAIEEIIAGNESSPI